ncbi:putative HD superfamily hydrolase involved in NAD metabolism [Hypnocyclicus thermotrophus]|uniref:bis(5'-nucleosyl)-tetraphosphatase (symmetrical) n=1 Tax=Hypnocyclicus thermotrophus TaxID=1627895 RepID=A0AA46DYJ9_9FUSO|nr:bis(5'-nucleosyl)-tetraphosphatase (symmetrical) YqeK [Hypnocyclicus thermotrophus]TDT70502.1 putative HD superfamily hydrolase involved in NAD metabolism [Hypnocyclicus thermotrophus]
MIDYKEKNNFIKEKIKEFSTEKRYKHILSVTNMAKKLAIHYNVNVDKIETAALLHDVSKHFTLNEMLNFLDKEEIEQEYLLGELLHGYAGAVFSRNFFKINDKDILNAIKYHTIGRKAMSIYEKIIYIADAIEETRNYEGVKKLRKLAFEDINLAILKEADLKIKFLIDKNVIIHPSTLEMRNYYLNKIYGR